MERHRMAKKYFRLVLLIAVAVSMTVLVFGQHRTGTAQNNPPQLSLNSPVSFPGDI